MGESKHINICLILNFSHLGYLLKHTLLGWLKFVKIKEGWEVEQTLQFGLSYDTVGVVVRNIKIYAKVATDHINPLESGRHET